METHAPQKNSKKTLHKPYTASIGYTGKANPPAQNPRET